MSGPGVLPGREPLIPLLTETPPFLTETPSPLDRELRKEHGTRQEVTSYTPKEHGTRQEVTSYTPGKNMWPSSQTGNGTIHPSPCEQTNGCKNVILPKLCTQESTPVGCKPPACQLYVAYNEQVWHVHGGPCTVRSKLNQLVWTCPGVWGQQSLFSEVQCRRPGPISFFQGAGGGNPCMMRSNALLAIVTSPFPFRFQLSTPTLSTDGKEGEFWNWHDDSFSKLKVKL